MAMNATVLGAALKSAVDNAVASVGAGHVPDRDEMFRAMAQAIITHITSTAIITVTVASVGGVMPGVGVSGPGAGTATIA